MLSFEQYSSEGGYRNLPRLSIPSVSRLGPPIDLLPCRLLEPNAFSQGLDDTPSRVFLTTRSRVVRLNNFRSLSPSLIAALLNQKTATPSPITVWALKDECHSLEGARVMYCVYRTHEEARQILSSPSSSLFSVSPALEIDLEPFSKLRRIDIKPSSSSAAVSVSSDSSMSSYHSSSPVASLPPISPPRLGGMNAIRQAASCSDFREPVRPTRANPVSRTALPISSNPPNVRSNFRLGDWICSSSLCGAHNFGRNVACIGCGCPRPHNFPVQTGPAPGFSSPRFSGVASFKQSADFMAQRRPSLPELSKPAASPYPVLTPSGKQLSIGGKVQNVSPDPLSPCFMFWSFNEPLPHPGQLRPTLSAVLQHPPILNTGNRGPIEHQPGDWICYTCNYLNWRRRKICQTCYPYAEGNGDSVSAAVQAERISLLANVLSSDPSPPPVSTYRSLPPSPSTHAFSSHVASSLAVAPVSRNLLPRSRSHADLFQEQPIYQTSGLGYSSTPAPLLPSFLQDIMQSPTLSPTSSTSAEFSLEEYEDNELTSHSPPRRSRKTSPGLSTYSIWKLDGDETKAYDF